MKKILAISSSPSEGRNSDSMLDAFIAGMNEMGGVEVHKEYLKDIPIEPYSYQNKYGPSVDETKLNALLLKLERSDGLVIATPTYNFSVPGHLKNFIDRIGFIALDYMKKTKLGQPQGKLSYLKAYFLVSGGTPAWAQKILFFAFPPFWLRGVFLYFNARVMGAYYTGDTEAFKNKKILDKCRKKGRRFAKQVLKGKRQGILEYIFWRPPQR